MTQYGTLKTWEVSEEKVSIDNVYLSDVTVQDLNILERDYISFRIGIKEDAIHKGGINLFGRKLGDHPQNIKFKMTFCN